MDKVRAAQLVTKWIADFHVYLKDGGGASGIHNKAKQGLVDRIAEAFAAVRAQEGLATRPMPAKRSPKKPKAKGDED